MQRESEGVCHKKREEGKQKSHMHSGPCVPHAADRRRTDRARVLSLIFFCVRAPASQSASVAALTPPQDAHSPEKSSIRSDALRS